MLWKRFLQSHIALFTLVLVCNLCLGISSSHAKTDSTYDLQAQITVSGVVSDAGSGEVLPGVYVLLQGTSIGTVTNIEGRYSLTVPSLNETLVFTYVGYESLVVPINGQSIINIDLQVAIITASDVVVTALGIRRDVRSLGYSTSTIDSDAISVNRTVSAMQSLQGEVSGLNISSMSSGAAGSTKIRIRGQSSFGADNSPLIVVDGVPITNPQFGRGDVQGRANFDAGDGLSSINPDNIESITVLKGGAAAALYGSRAKDGVIMITTKNSAGDRGIRVTYNNNFTIDKAVNDTDWQYEYGQGEGGLRPTSAFPESGVWSWGEKIEPGMTHVLFNGLVVPYEAQKNQLTDFYSGGYSLTNTLTLAAGNSGSGFNFTISRLNNESIAPNSGYDRTNATIGFTQNIYSNLNISGSVNYTREEHLNPQQLASQFASTPRVLYTLANTMPLSVLRENQVDENGNELIWSRFRARTNPYFSAEKFSAVQLRDRVFGNITARYDINNWLFAQARFGQDYFVRDLEFRIPTGIASLAAAPAGFNNGEMTQEIRRFREVNADFLVGATHAITKDLGLSANVGGNMMYNHAERNSIYGIDFIVRDLYAIGNTRTQTPLYVYSERQVNSLYGSVDFNFKDYWYVSLTARNDWFSTLSKAERSVLYPSISSSFVFSDVFDGLPSWLNSGILRLSYAEVGSDTDVNAFSSSIGYNVNPILLPSYGGSLQPLGMISSNTIPSKNLRPMRVNEYEIGVALSLFQRVNLDVTYYNKLSIDQIMNAAIPSVSGYTSQLVNAGESVNRGVEMLIDVVALQNQNLTWSVRFNGSYNTSEVLKLGLTGDEVSIGNQTRQIVGLPLGQIWRRGYLRDDQGRVIFNPNNGMPLANVGQAWGSAIPKWVGGISNSFQYKEFSFSALVDYKLGHVLNSQIDFQAWRHGLHKGTLVGRDVGFVVGDGVLPDGSPNTTAVPVQTYYESITGSQNDEEFIQNAGYWKLRQITIDYNFTKLVSKYIPVRGLVLSAVINNVYTIKRWTENIDPEQAITTSDSGVGNRIGETLPMTRSYGFNLRVQF